MAQGPLNADKNRGRSPSRIQKSPNDFITRLLDRVDLDTPKHLHIAEVIPENSPLRSV